MQTGEFTCVLMKPEALMRGTVGFCLEQLEDKGLELIHFEMMQLTPEVVNEQYKEYSQVGIKQNIAFSVSKGPCILMLFYGVNACKNVRKHIGFFKPQYTEPGTIRFKYVSSLKQGSVIHASDNQTEAIHDLKRLLPHKFKEIYREVLCLGR